jgi:hypothetical protein
MEQTAKPVHHHKRQIPFCALCEYFVKQNSSVFVMIGYVKVVLCCSGVFCHSQKRRYAAKGLTYETVRRQPNKQHR